MSMLKNMLKEEWRIHSSFFGNMNFAMVPVLMLILSFLGCLVMNQFENFIEINSSLISHFIFLFFGINVGAFGLFGKEFMNRRFGQASLLAYSSRTLPVSERKIFLDMIIKDIIYYTLIWIIPFISGYCFTLPITGNQLNPFIWISLPLAFMLGLSIVFLLSMIYANSSRIFITIFSLSSVLLILLAGIFSSGMFAKFPPYAFYITHDFIYFGISIIIILACFILSLIFFKIDYPEENPRYKDQMKISERLKFGIYSPFMMKDVLDLKRSEGGIGKIIFSFFFPMAFIWLFLSIFTKVIPGTDFLIIFTIFLGVYSPSFYTWITEYDLFNQYLFLPVKVSTIIKSKIRGFLILNILSLIALISAGSVYGEIKLLIVAIPLYMIISFFSLAITIYFTGLSPNIYLMNFRVLIKYLASIVPIMTMIIFTQILSILAFIIILLLILSISLIIFKKSFTKWDNSEQMQY
jgi:hypothetical protein